MALFGSGIVLLTAYIIGWAAGGEAKYDWYEYSPAILILPSAIIGILAYLQAVVMVALPLSRRLDARFPRRDVFLSVAAALAVAAVIAGGIGALVA
ncbi:MAG: hypothetical protein WEC75_14510 [Dehalococcoidia bacterium]